MRKAATILNWVSILVVILSIIMMFTFGFQATPNSGEGNTAGELSVLRTSTIVFIISGILSGGTCVAHLVVEILLNIKAKMYGGFRLFFLIFFHIAIVVTYLMICIIFGSLILGGTGGNVDAGQKLVLAPFILVFWFGLIFICLGLQFIMVIMLLSMLKHNKKHKDK